MRLKWTKEMIEKLTELFPTTCNRDLSKILNVTINKLKDKACKLKLKKLIRSQNWTAKEIEDLKLLYPDNDIKKLVDYFGRNDYSIYNKAHALGIKKTPEYIEQAKLLYAEHVKKIGKDFRFVKGQNSWNKGVKGYMRSNRTSFKKGNRPKNYLPVGSESIDVDGYVKVKIQDPSKWELKHRIIWSERFGEVPDHYAVIFVDGDKRNFDIHNLALIHRRELLYINRWGKYPSEIMEAEKLIYQLKNLVKNNGKEQN